MDRNTNFQNQSTEQASPSSSTRPLSIEAPRTTNNANQVEIVANQPRQPANFQDLLRFAVEATNVEEGPNEPTLYPTDAERKQFLAEALKSMSINIVEELQRDVKLLKGLAECEPWEKDEASKYEAALDRIADRVDSIDMANDFYAIGGFSIFGSCLNSIFDGVRWRAANLIAEITQNNSFCQEKVLKEGLLPTLLSRMQYDKCELTRIKALYAVSCIVRGSAIGLRHMEEYDGFYVLIRTLQSPIQKLQIKSAFLLSSLCFEEEGNNLKLTLIEMGLIEKACGLLAKGCLPLEAREQLLNMLSALVNDHNYSGLKECRRPELCLKQTLERHLQELKAEDCIDTERRCSELLATIFPDVELELES